MSASPPGRSSTARYDLMDAAIRLMSRRQPSTISGRDLAAEAGVNYGLVHYYFDSFIWKVSDHRVREGLQ